MNEHADITIQDLDRSHFKAAETLWAEGGFGSEPQLWERLQTLITMNPGLSKVALDGEAVVGIALCSQNGFSGYVFRLVVNETHRGQGIGGQLMSACEEALSAMGIPKVFVNAEPPLHEWYARLGFQKTDASFLFKFL